MSSSVGPVTAKNSAPKVTVTVVVPECSAWMTEPDTLYKYLPFYTMTIFLVSRVHSSASFKYLFLHELHDGDSPGQNGPPTSNIPQLAQAHVAPLLANGGQKTTNGTGPKKYGSRIDCHRCGIYITLIIFAIFAK